MTTRTTDQKLQKLQAENALLRAENKKLRAQTKAVTDASDKRRPLRASIVVLCVAFATALLVVGNILFWAGNTVVKQDQFVAATAPIIKNPEVQSALTNAITAKLFAQVDIEQLTEEALPPRAAFLAPTLSTQVKQQADNAVQTVLERPQFQERWNNTLARAHDRFITTVEKHGDDGSIDISEVYTDVSQQLKGTKLGFLADKQLPAKVGHIELVSGGWLTVLQRTIQNIDLWRSLTIVLLVVVAVLGVWLGRNRRKVVMALSVYFALAMFITLVSLRVGKEILAGQAQPQNAEAARQVYGIFTSGLVAQTRTLLIASLLIALVAWISGPYRSAEATRRKIDQLLSGKIHQAIFGSKENLFTLWLGRYRRVIEWLIVALAACVVLFIKLTPTILVGQIAAVVALVLLVEILAAKE